MLACEFDCKESDRKISSSFCKDGFFDYLRSINCSDVEVYAISEGSVVFPKVPLMRVEGPVAVSTMKEMLL